MAEPLEDWMDVTRPHGVQLSQSDLAPGTELVMPACDAVVLVWLQEGEVELVLQDGDAHTLDAGSVALMSQGPAHRLQSQTGATLLCGAYSGSRCPVTSVWAGLPDVVLLDSETVRAESRITSVAALIREELDEPQHGSQPLLGSLMDALMMYLLRAWSRSSARGPSWMAGLEDPMLVEPLRELHEAPAEDWTVERLASVAGVSRAVFSRHFSEQMGEPPMQYVRRWRMAMAARLLLYGDASVAEIAERVGYTSEFAFNRAFKRVVGEPPGRFRREN